MTIFFNLALSEVKPCIPSERQPDCEFMSFLFLFRRAFLTEGMKYNLKMILFWGPGSPFQNNWKLREEFRNPANR